LSQLPNVSYEVFIDTSIAIAVLRRDQAASARFSSIDPVVSITVIGELLYGATRAQRRDHQRSLIANLVANSRVLTLDQETAEQYATLKRGLELQGTPIPENDTWIAASALQHGLPLATRDDHFERVPGLVVERW
jgi:tRNA(fMet)-specific endonuclease VapC